jgi:proline iminopeptidase
MLLLMYLIEKKAVGVRSAILSSTLPASWLWGREQHRMIRYMSAEDPAAIREAEESGDYSSEAYETANEHFMERHCAPSKREREAAARKAAEAAAAGKIVSATPECLTRPKRSGTESYVTAWGPNEYTPLGTLKDFDYIDRLGEISVPCLVVSGTDDLCTPLIAKTMADGIPGARWELFENCRHMCFAENHPRYVKMMREWLAEE